MKKFILMILVIALSTSGFVAAYGQTPLPQSEQIRQDYGAIVNEPIRYISVYKKPAKLYYLPNEGITAKGLVLKVFTESGFYFVDFDLPCNEIEVLQPTTPFMNRTGTESIVVQYKGFNTSYSIRWTPRNDIKGIKLIRKPTQRSTLAWKSYCDWVGDNIDKISAFDEFTQEGQIAIAQFYDKGYSEYLNLNLYGLMVAFVYYDGDYSDIIPVENFNIYIHGEYAVSYTPKVFIEYTHNGRVFRTQFTPAIDYLQN